MVTYRTLFERLGVDTLADDKEIEDARDRWALKYDCNLAAIPRDVAHAYRFLANHSNREHYRDLLDACEHGHEMEFAPDQHADLKALCRDTEIVWYTDLHRKNIFHFRRPDQPPPKWLQPPIPPQVVVQHVSTSLWRFLTLRSFYGTSLRRKIVLGAAYAALLCFVVGSLEWAARGRDNSLFAGVVVGPSAAAIELAQRKALEQSILSKQANASATLMALTNDSEIVRRDFKQLVGFEWDVADERGVAKPRILDLAIIRHESVREAWTSLLAARIPRQELESRSDAVVAIGLNTKSMDFRTDDERNLIEILAWGQEKERQMQAQARNIEHLRVMLAAETFELAGNESERRLP